MSNEYVTRSLSLQATALRGRDRACKFIERELLSLSQRDNTLILLQLFNLFGKIICRITTNCIVIVKKEDLEINHSCFTFITTLYFILIWAYQIISIPLTYQSTKIYLYEIRYRTHTETEMNIYTSYLIPS